MNQFVLTGRLKENFIYNCSKKYTLFKLTSKYNEEDIIIYIKVPNSITSDYIKVGDLLGIKGHFESKGLEHRSLICDKLTFLSSEVSK
jgi:hypothetical protein